MLAQEEEINKHAKKRKKKERKRKHMATCGNENVCEGKEYNSNSGSSSNMGRVTKVSSLCLDYQGRKRRKKREER